jgi:hypothetical protein
LKGCSKQNEPVSSTEVHNKATTMCPGLIGHPML